MVRHEVLAGLDEDEAARTEIDADTGLGALLRNNGLAGGSQRHAALMRTPHAMPLCGTTVGARHHDGSRRERGEQA
jgi:hypothetical protein